MRARRVSVCGLTTLFPTRLETRTKESNMCASRWVFTKPAGATKVNVGRIVLVARTAGLWLASEQERTRWDPKDGELCLSRMKPEETLLEVRSDSDVQIDRRTWV